MTFFAEKYASFVWPAYGISFLGLALATAIVWHHYARAAARWREVQPGNDRQERQD